MEGTPIIVKKKKAHAHAHHGGSWKVAYADFVTAMMAFFMVMWILGLSDESKAQISGYFNDPNGYSKTQPLTRNLVSFPGTPVAGGAVKPHAQVKKQKLAITYIFKRMQQVLEDAMKAGVKGPDGKLIQVKDLASHLSMEITKEGLRIEFQESKTPVFFESGSAVIKPTALALLSKLSPILAKSGHAMKVEGHTDSVPYAGRDYDNWDLSGDRANAMRRALMSGGVKSAQFLTVAGFADTRLRDADHPTSPVNRRVSVLLPIADFAGVEGSEGAAQVDLNGEVELAPEVDLKAKPKRKPRGPLGF